MMLHVICLRVKPILEENWFQINWSDQAYLTKNVGNKLVAQVAAHVDDFFMTWEDKIEKLINNIKSILQISEIERKKKWFMRLDISKKRMEILILIWKSMPRP